MNTSLSDLLRATALCSSIALGLAACGKAPDAPAATMPAAPAAVVEVSDMDVTTGVKTSLLADDKVKGLDITVVTLKGDVLLTGMVDTQAQRDQAVSLARAVPGAHSVHDELTMKK